MRQRSDRRGILSRPFLVIQRKQQQGCHRSYGRDQIPLYTISVTDKQRPVADSLRIGVDGAQLATGARIEVYVWYKDNTTLQHTFPKILAFSGFIRKW